MNGRQCWALVVLSVGAACADGSPVPDRPVWPVERTTTFGDAEGPGALSDVFSVAVDAAGRTFLSEPQFARVVAFDADGSFDRVLGARGQGPGEFQIPGGLSWHGDTLVVTDFRLGLNLFGPDGTFARRVSFQGAAGGNASFPTIPVVLLADGAVMAVTPVASSAVTSGQVGEEVLFRTDEAGAVLDTVVVVPLAGRLVDVTLDGRVRSQAHPLAWEPLAVLPPHATSVVVVERTPAPGGATRDSVKIVRVDLHGDTVASGVLPYVPLPVSSAQVDSVADALGTRWAEGADRPTAPAVDAYRDQVAWPASFPPVTRALAGDDGSVWLRREGPVGDSVAWDVLDAGLVYTGRVHVPTGLDLKVVTAAAIYGIERDALDVPVLVRYDIRR